MKRKTKEEFTLHCLERERKKKITYIFFNLFSPYIIGK